MKVIGSNGLPSTQILKYTLNIFRNIVANSGINTRADLSNLITLLPSQTVGPSMVGTMWNFTLVHSCKKLE